MTARTKTPAPTTSPRRLRLATVRWPADSTARKLTTSPYLAALLEDDAGLADGLDRYSAAFRVSTEAARLSRQATGSDVTEEITAAILAGDEDAAGHMARIVESCATTRENTEAAAQLENISDGFLSSLARDVDAATDGLLAQIAARLDVLLEAGTVALAELGEARTAEAAIDAGRTEAWTSLRAIHRDYVELRSGHTSLLRAERPNNFTDGSDQLAWAYFARPEAAFPALGAVAAGEVQTATHRLDVRAVAASSVNLADPRDFNHLLLAIEGRGLVGTHAASAVDALDARSVAIAAARAAGERTTNQAEGADLAAHYGGEAGVQARYSR